MKLTVTGLVVENDNGQQVLFVRLPDGHKTDEASLRSTFFRIAPLIALPFVLCAQTADGEWVLYGDGRTGEVQLPTWKLAELAWDEIEIRFP